ncbi:MAG: hypothetical protein KUG77_09305 [Nannocystaceae bacterium]|nr:hypothetical protein [Nannocystaceae bacterium]
MKTEQPDRLERYARYLWKRWLRAARYAQQTSVVDAVLRYRLKDHQEVRKAVRDVLAGPEGLVYMLHRARKAARYRLKHEVEDLAIRIAFSMPMGSRDAIAKAVRRAGYAVSPSTIRRVLVRRGLWARGGVERAS